MKARGGSVFNSVLLRGLPPTGAWLRLSQHDLDKIVRLAQELGEDRAKTAHRALRAGLAFMSEALDDEAVVRGRRR